MFFLFYDFKGLEALGSDIGTQDRFLEKHGYALRWKTHSFGGQFSALRGILFDAVFEEAPGSQNQ